MYVHGDFFSWGGHLMNAEKFERKLSAILSADVEGYSRLMGEDEEETVRTLTAYRNAMADLIQQFRGRVRNRYAQRMNMASAQHSFEKYRNAGLGIEGIGKPNQPLNTHWLFRCASKPVG